MSLTVVVLGMHRSGTSCLMQALQKAGMFLGADLLSDVPLANVEGHFEAKDAVAINDRILELSGGSWTKIPSTLRYNEGVARRMDRFIQTFSGKPVSGWKDPRTTVTFPLWKSHLSNYRIIACLRHPTSVARSLQVRDGLTMEAGLDLWAAYNEHLLQAVANQTETWWFDYDAPAADRTAAVQAMCLGLGLSYDQTVADVFNPFMRHHAHNDVPADPRIRSLYEKLQERAAPNSGTGVSAVPPLPISPPAAPSAAEESATIRELHAQLAQLARVVQAQNEITQQLNQKMCDLNSYYASEFNRLHSRLRRIHFVRAQFPLKIVAQVARGLVRGVARSASTLRGSKSRAA